MGARIYRLYERDSKMEKEIDREKERKKEQK